MTLNNTSRCCQANQIGSMEPIALLTIMCLFIVQFFDYRYISKILPVQCS